MRGNSMGRYTNKPSYEGHALLIVRESERKVCKNPVESDRFKCLKCWSLVIAVSHGVTDFEPLVEAYIEGRGRPYNS